MRTFVRYFLSALFMCALSIGFSSARLIYAQTANCTAPPSGMTAWYPGDGNFKDIQGGNNGAPVGSVTFAPGKVDQAFNLNRTGYVQAPDSPSSRPTSQITLDAWVKITDVADERIIDKITANSPDGYLLDLINARPRVIIGSTLVTSNNQIPLNTFVHLAGTYDGAQVRLYVNGVLDASAALTGAIPTNNSPLRIGADSNGLNQFNGLIDEVEIFNRALTQTEIQSIVNADTQGKCKAAVTNGALIISEFRLQGATTNDEFIELYNNTDAAVNVNGYSVVVNGITVTLASASVPARGHYLLVNGLGYSLTSYAAADRDYSATVADAPVDSSLSLLNASGQVLDKVGFTTSPAGSCEGTCLTATSALGQHSFLRRMESGLPRDTDNNASDFILVATDPTAVIGSRLGAPGPESTQSPRMKRADTEIQSRLIDPSVSSTASPNRFRNSAPYTDSLTPSAPNGGAPATNPYTSGTLSIQRRFVNQTGSPVTRLRFRVVDITTLNTPNIVGGGAQADVRLLSSDGVTRAPVVSGLKGLTLEQPPTQPRGGGWNSSVVVDLSALPGGNLGASQSVDVQFLLGVASGGSYRFFIIVEALP